MPDTKGTRPLTVYIVGWYSQGSGGFDWYFSEADADRAYHIEEVNALEFAAEGWTAWRHTHTTTETDREAITREIDGDLSHFENTAPIRFCAALEEA